MPDATLLSSGDTIDIVPANSVSVGQILQLKDGRAAFAESSITAGDLGVVRVRGVARVTKTAGVALIDGCEVFWDYSADAATYKPVNDRDFPIGTAVGDWTSTSTIMSVALNEKPRYLIDLMRDPYRSTPVGTQALGGLAIKRNGGALNFVHSSTSEAQKLDALSVAGFSKDANAIAEFIFAVVNDGAGSAVDVSLGVASATHATDADSIAEHVFCHLDANNTNINFQSKDGSTTVTSTDSTKDYVEGSAVANLVYVWIDMRNPADVQCYVNAELVLDATTFNVNAAVGPLFLLAHSEKTSAADVYELDLHAARIRIAEQ